MVSVENLHWGNFLINGVYRWRDEYGHETSGISFLCATSYLKCQAPHNL